MDYKDRKKLQKIYLVVRPLRGWGGSKGRNTKKKELILKLENKIQKKRMTTKLEGGGDS